MKVFAVNIQKGGSSKTLTCQVLAELLSKEHGKRVLCIDTDPQCNLTSVSGIDITTTQKHNLKTLLDGKSDVNDCIYKAKYYDIIPSSILLSNSDATYTATGREHYLSEKIKDLDFDYCFIDTPPGLCILNIMSLTAASEVLIPTECSVLALIGLEQLQSTISTIRTYSNRDLQIAGILVTRYNGRANINSSIYESLQEISKSLNARVFDTRIRETVKIKEAQAQFLPILDYAEKCSAVEDYRAFIEESKLFT